MPQQGEGVAHGSDRRPAAHEWDLMPDQYVASIERDAVVVEGPDATSFLQSLVSQDLDPVAVGETVHALLLQPQGKLIADFYAVRTADDTWWLITEGGVGAPLAEGLNRFKIRVKADVGPQEVAALAVRGVELVPADGVVLATVEWSSGPAFDAVGSPSAIDALVGSLNLPMIGGDAYELARIEAGVPRQGADTDERTIPQEAGLELTAVSFTKGCFVGQELVCRIDSRGHVNRFLRRLRADGPIDRGLAVHANGKEVGTVTSAVNRVGLAMLRREVEPGATVTVGAGTAVVEAI
jgi:folate-binding protein YgfZ